MPLRYLTRFMACAFLFAGPASEFLSAAIFPGTAYGQFQITEINPDSSDSTDPDSASGGRVNHIGATPGNGAVYYAASEFGGLYKSQDRGNTWLRIDGHLQNLTIDVKVSPFDQSRVIATSFYDGRVDTQAGINVSTDAGKTWTHPVTARPPEGFCDNPEKRSEFSAFGISFDQNSPNNVYVGTTCGLAISNDAGASWHFVDPTPLDPATNVYSVVVHDGGIIDLCGDDGHLRSTDGGAVWTRSSSTGTPLPSGNCSLAVSPYESYVLFATVGPLIFESDNGGSSWIRQAYTNPSSGRSRGPFVKTNRHDGTGFDLWFGEVSLYRMSCTTPMPASSGGSQRCSKTWSSGFTRSAGAHDDTGDLIFASPGSEASGDACPFLLSSDGGVFINTKTTSLDCHSPLWKQPTRSPHALLMFGMDSAHRSAGTGTSLYIANQDNGTFSTLNAEAAAPKWSGRTCCDAYDVSASSTRVLSTWCCYDANFGAKLLLWDEGVKNNSEINTYPPPKYLRATDKWSAVFPTKGMHS